MNSTHGKEKIPISQVAWQISEVVMNFWILFVLIATNITPALIIWTVLEIIMNSWILVTFSKVGLKKVLWRKDTMADYITGTGQTLRNVHSEEVCAGRPCVIHNPSDHGMRDFPTHWREDRGIIERICNHSTGHPDPDLPFEKDSHEFIHGCDGCCGGCYNQ